MSAAIVSEPDVTVENHGSVVLVRPVTRVGHMWIKENVQGDAQHFGGALAVEPRYLPQLVDGMIGDGLLVE